MADKPIKEGPNKAQSGVRNIISAHNKANQMKEGVRAATLTKAAKQSDKALNKLKANMQHVLRMGTGEATVNSITNITKLGTAINSLSPIKIMKAKASLKILGTSLDAFHGRNFEQAEKVGTIIDSLQPMKVIKARLGMVLLGKSLEKLGNIIVDTEEKKAQAGVPKGPESQKIVEHKGLTPAQIQKKMVRDWATHEDEGGNEFSTVSTAAKNQKKIETDWNKSQWDEGQGGYTPETKGPKNIQSKRHTRGSEDNDRERSYKNKRKKKAYDVEFAGGGILSKIMGGAKALGRAAGIGGTKTETPVKTPAGQQAVIGEKGPEAIVPLKKMPEVADAMSEKMGGGSNVMMSNQQEMINNQERMESVQSLESVKSTETLRELGDVKHKLGLMGGGGAEGIAGGAAAMAGGGGLLSMLSNFLPNLKERFEKFKESFGNIKDKLKANLDKITNKFKSIKNDVFEKAASIKKSLKDIGAKIWKSVGPRLSGIMGKAADIFSGLKGKMGSVADAAKEKMGNVASAAKDKAGAAWDWLKGKGGKVKEMGSNVLSKGKDMASKLNPMNLIKKSKGEIFPKLAKGMKKLAKKLPGIGPLLLLYEGVTTASEAYDLIKGGASPREVALQMMPKAGEALGSLIGAGAGSMIPIPILGTLGGALAGGAAGRMLTKYFAPDIVDALGIGKSMKFPEAVQKKMAMAEGGIVTKPIDALIGEAGPEAVIPLAEGFKEFGDNLFDHFVKRTEDAGSVDGLKSASIRMSLGSMTEQSAEQKTTERTQLAYEIASMIQMPESSNTIITQDVPPQPMPALRSADNGHMHNVYNIKFNI